MMVRRPFIYLLLLLAGGHSLSLARADSGEPCWVRQQDRRTEIVSPFFVFHLDTTGCLRATAWANRLSGRTLSLDRVLGGSYFFLTSPFPYVQMAPGQKSPQGTAAGSPGLPSILWPSPARRTAPVPAYP